MKESLIRNRNSTGWIPKWKKSLDIFWVQRWCYWWRLLCIYNNSVSDDEVEKDPSSMWLSSIFLYSDRYILSRDGDELWVEWNEIIEQWERRELRVHITGEGPFISCANIKWKWWMNSRIKEIQVKILYLIQHLSQCDCSYLHKCIESVWWKWLNGITPKLISCQDLKVSHVANVLHYVVIPLEWVDSFGIECKSVTERIQNTRNDESGFNGGIEPRENFNWIRKTWWIKNERQAWDIAKWSWFSQKCQCCFERWVEDTKLNVRIDFENE